ncbi:pyridoxal phosphate-dependent acyltransferase, partial [mine drainage metagenome]
MLKLPLRAEKYLNMCSNNYLGLANHPEIKKAAIRAIEEFGVGAGAVRSIAGTMEIHAKLEEKVAKFKHMESALVYQGGLLANIGTIPTLIGKEDIVFSEELNHASIIDGMRLSSAKRYVY